MYGGSSSGKTIHFVINQSSIINVYRQCIEDTEDDFHIPEKTLYHAAPDIQSRMDGLKKTFYELRPHRYERARKVPHLVADYFQKGCEQFQRGTMWNTTTMDGAEDDEHYSVEAVDLGV